jgi:putative spermidine/putrescine transport system permease protein
VALTTPLLVLLVAFLAWPILVMALASLEGNQGLSFSLRIYGEILTERRYLEAFWQTAFLAIISTILALLICIPSAIYIEDEPSRARRFAAVALAFPLSLPGIVIGFFVILGFGRTGVVTDWLKAATSLSNPQLAYTFWGLLLGYVYFQIPRAVLVLRGGVATISDDVVDAARTLGATPLRVYADVVLPALLPAIVSAASLSLATAFGAFGTAATLSRAYRVVPLEIATLFTERFQPDKAAALSVLLGIVTVGLLLTLGRFGAGRRA